MPEAARFWAEAVRCEPEAVGPRLELAEAYGWLGQDAGFEREWRAALELLPEDQQPVAWSRRGKVLRTVVCNPRASLAAYQRASELPADAPGRCGWTSCSAPPGARRWAETRRALLRSWMR
jgi:hypothetical protein